jgi:hypothetical protein
MPVFRIYKDTKDAVGEFKGTVLAGRQFSKSFPKYDSESLFAGFIYDLINTDNCFVTYAIDGNDQFDVHGKFDEADDKFKFWYVPDQMNPNNKVKLKLISNQDDPTDRRVTMAIPARAVTEAEAYLDNAVANIEHVPGGADDPIKEADKPAYLLGLLLLKRCR